MKNLIKLVAATIFSSTLAFATPHTIDSSHTEVGFSVKHLMITNVKGEFTKFDAELDFDYKTKVFNKLEAEIETKSVDTGIEKRDNHLRSEDFFYAEKYPNITFKMKSYKADGDEGVMIGDLTIRGVTKEVKLEVEDLGTIKDFNGNNRVGFSLKGKINRGDFDLKWNKALELGGFAVGEQVKITVEIEAVENK
jgi:polyisoprenoid-binding protein YceI